MKKILVTITILIYSIFANNFEQNMVILEELEEIFQRVLNEQSFKLKYKELSTTKKIQYYDNLIKKIIELNAKIVKRGVGAKKYSKSTFFLPLIKSSFKNLVNKNGPSEDFGKLCL